MRTDIALAVAIALFAFGAAPSFADETDRKPRSSAGAGATLDEAPFVPGRTHVRYSFEELDLNNDGAIATSEAMFKQALAENFVYADKNGNGTLNKPEFEEAMAMAAEMYGHGARSAHKRRIFRNLDMDSDGLISRTEAKWRPELADATFAAADADGDGSLGPSEFGELTLSELSGPHSSDSR